MLWSVETDATVTAAQAVAPQCSWFQSGRLGREATCDHTTALATTIALQVAGYKAWMSPAPGAGPWREAAVSGLAAYKQGREGLPEAVHAGLEAKMTKSEIARIAGLSRPGLDKIIDRYDLERIVEGE